MIYDVGNLINAQRQLQLWRTKEALCNVQRENRKAELMEKGIPKDQITDDDCAPVESKCCGCSKQRID